MKFSGVALYGQMFYFQIAKTQFNILEGHIKNFHSFIVMKRKV